MRFVILESPYAADTPRGVASNEGYARECLLDCLLRGDAPFASHLLYTQPGVLRDTADAERRLGVEAGLCIGDCADATVVYTDRGISLGMRYGIDRAKSVGRLIEYRQIVGLDPGRSRLTGRWTK